MKAVLLDTHIFLLGKLPKLHRDPFDRLLIATALVNGLDFATVDRRLEDYPRGIHNRTPTFRDCRQAIHSPETPGTEANPLSGPDLRHAGRLPSLKRFMKKPIKYTLTVFVAIFVAIQLIPVERDNPPIASDLDAPVEVKDVLRRSCYDCHSNEVKWPWYS